MFGLFTAIFPDFSAGPGLLADALKMCSFIQQIFTECHPGARHVSGYYGYSTEQNKNGNPCNSLRSSHFVDWTLTIKFSDLFFMPGSAGDVVVVLSSRG